MKLPIVPMGLAICAFASILFGCGPPSPEQEARYHNADIIRESLSNGKVTLIATAPDGTKLWGYQVSNDGRNIYFSSGGTQSTYTEGKSTHTENVPNSN